MPKPAAAAWHQQQRHGARASREGGNDVSVRSPVPDGTHMRGRVTRVANMMPSHTPERRGHHFQTPNTKLRATHRQPQHPSPPLPALTRSLESPRGPVLGLPVGAALSRPDLTEIAAAAPARPPAAPEPLPYLTSCPQSTDPQRPASAGSWPKDGSCCCCCCTSPAPARGRGPTLLASVPGRPAARRQPSGGGSAGPEGKASYTALSSGQRRRRRYQAA